VDQAVAAAGDVADLCDGAVVGGQGPEPDVGGEACGLRGGGEIQQTGGAGGVDVPVDVLVSAVGADERSAVVRADGVVDCRADIGARGQAGLAVLIAVVELQKQIVAFIGRRAAD